MYSDSGHKASDNVENISLFFLGKHSLLDYLSDICGENIENCKKKTCECTRN